MESTPKLIIFARAPRPGEVKSRLAGKFGADRACAIYRSLLDSLFGNLQNLKNVELHITPAGAEEEFQPWVKPWVKVRTQCQGGLGARLIAAFEGCEGEGGRLVIGSDCPYVTRSDIQNARKELASHDVVLGPSIDGGYWLIGLKKPFPELFEDIPWSTDQVLGQTLRKARELGLKVQLLNILSDIDTPEDYQEWERSKGPNSK